MPAYHAAAVGCASFRTTIREKKWVSSLSALLVYELEGLLSSDLPKIRLLLHDILIDLSVEVLREGPIDYPLEVASTKEKRALMRLRPHKFPINGIA